MDMPALPAAHRIRVGGRTAGLVSRTIDILLRRIPVWQPCMLC
jgi:hypothetical protein